MTQIRTMLLGATLSVALIAPLGCKPAESEPNKTPKEGSGAPAAGSETPKAVAPVQVGAEGEIAAARQIADRLWAYYDANYNKGNPNAKTDREISGDTWGPNANPAFSAFVVLGGLKTGHLKLTDLRLKDTINAILDRQQPTGSFDIVPGTGFRAVYTTSFCIELLSWLRDNGGDEWKKNVGAPVARAMDYIRRAQIGSPDGPMADASADSSIVYGGWAYSEQELADQERSGGKPLANMSTSIFALDAAAAFGVEKDDPLWQRATTFLGRNQNSGEVEKGVEIKTPDGTVVAEPDPGSANEGGARYSPDSSMAGATKLADGRVVLSSYGSMTYALLRGYLHSGLSKDDPRVQLAWRWLRHNFDVTRVPGYVNTEKAPDADKQGYYYQFMQMTRTFLVFGEDSFEDAKGNKRVWRTEMLNQLGRLQRADGSFQNDHDRWMEATIVGGGYILNSLGDVIRHAQKPK